MNTKPFITANFEPFRLIIADNNDIWKTNLSEINTKTYNDKKLNKISLELDIGIENNLLSVSYDGTLFLPRTDKFRDPYYTMSVFNQVLTCCFLGGLYCEAVTPDNIGYGSIDSNNESYILSGDGGKALLFHSLIKARLAGPTDTIKLLDANFVTAKNFKESYLFGKNIFEKFSNKLKLEQLLPAIKFYNNAQLSESLIFFWTSIEQLINYFWVYILNRKIKRDENMQFKIKELKKNTILSKKLFEELNEVRKARNHLAHSAIMPSKEITNFSVKCFFELLSLLFTDLNKESFFDDMKNKLINNCYSNLFIFNYPQETY